MVTDIFFGRCPLGEVRLLCLSDGAGARAELLTLGAAVRALQVPSRTGTLTDVCLGYDTAREYWDHDACLGATIGRCANRIAGASFVLGGQTWPLTANEGANQLHGGAGFHKKLWAYACGEHSVTFSLDSPAGEEGYPGALHVEVTYTLQNRCLTIDYLARADADTVVNLTNHTYFNLAGHTGGPVDDHVLTVRADRYTPCGQGNIPTGALADVGGTALDLRSGAALGSRLVDPLLAQTRGYDHNYALTDGDGPGAALWCPRTGIALEVATSLEGMQVYTAGFLTSRRGKAGGLYGPHHAVCLETQHFPDAIHHPNFPSPVLRAGADYRETTRFSFSIR